MASGEGRLDSGSWNGLLQGAAMPFMPGFFGGGDGPDAAALAAAYVQLQQQHPQFMGQNMQVQRFGGGNRTAYPPNRIGIKKCGHCQSMKPCMEFSADTSRGDGLRGWCKLCEAEARSTRYKKRKAAAQAAASARRKFEKPLGGGFWGGDGGNQGGSAGGGGGQFGGQFGAGMEPAVQQQLLAILAYQQQLHGGGPQQQQQQQQQGGGSAFQPLGGGGDFRGAGSSGKHSGGGTGTRSGSPVTSDSENSAMERFKKHRVGSPPGAPIASWVSAPGGAHAAAAAAAASAALRLASANSEDSAAAMALAFGPQAGALMAAIGQQRHAALAHAPAPDAPRPPTEVHVPKRSRTRYVATPELPPAAPAAGRARAPDSGAKFRSLGSLAAAATAPAPAAPALAPQPDVVQWASRTMAALLLIRASAHVRQPLTVPRPPAVAATSAVAVLPTASPEAAAVSVGRSGAAGAATTAVSVPAGSATQDEKPATRETIVV